MQTHTLMSLQNLTTITLKLAKLLQCKPKVGWFLAERGLTPIPFLLIAAE